LDTTFKIASYNIRKAVGLDWKRNPKRIFQVCYEINPDILILQEVDKRLGARSDVFDVEYLKQYYGYNIASVAHNNVSHGWHGNAIFYTSNFKEIQYNRIEIPYLEPRGAVHVTLQHKTEKVIDCVGVHLGLTQKMRIKQIVYIRKLLENMQTGNPQIIAGDFNQWYKNQSIGNAFGEDYKVTSPGASFHSAIPKLALNYIVTSKDLQIHGACVHHSDLSRKASDHLPISACIVIKG